MALSESRVSAVDIGDAAEGMLSARVEPRISLHVCGVGFLVVHMLTCVHASQMPTMGHEALEGRRHISPVLLAKEGKRAIERQGGGLTPSASHAKAVRHVKGASAPHRSAQASHVHAATRAHEGEGPAGCMGWVAAEFIYAWAMLSQEAHKIHIQRNILSHEY